jgi:hypothetical protein
MQTGAEGWTLTEDEENLVWTMAGAWDQAEQGASSRRWPRRGIRRRRARRLDDGWGTGSSGAVRGRGAWRREEDKPQRRPTKSHEPRRRWRREEDEEPQPRPMNS